MIQALQAIPLIGGLWKTVFGDKDKTNNYAHTEKMAVYDQFAKEFGNSKTWWDSLIDGLNRLPRPIMTFGIVWLFYYCITQPEDFTVSATALQAMPEPGWWLLGIIITFWFGGKVPKDFAKYQVQAGAVDVAKQVAQARQIKNTPKSVTADTTPHEQVDWGRKVEKRYANKDWENLND